MFYERLVNVDIRRDSIELRVGIESVYRFIVQRNRRIILLAQPVTQSAAFSNVGQTNDVERAIETRIVPESVRGSLPTAKLQLHALLDERVAVPGHAHRAGAESLNVAVAAGILVYEWLGSLMKSRP